MTDPITNADQAIEAAAKVAETWKSSLRPGTEARMLGHQEAARDIAAAIRALKDRIASPSDGAAKVKWETISRSEIKKLWVQHGGRQHGPHTEQYFIEERLFYPFAQALIAAALTLDPVAALRPQPDLRAQVAFLLDRISELDWSLDRDDFARDWHGHVEPALQRVADEIDRTLGDGAK